VARLFKDMNEIIGGNGGNWAYFAKNKKIIAEFIQANKLTPVGISAHAASEHMATGATSVRILKDLDIRGGIRVQHLHFDDHIYLLDEKQWAALSKEIVASFKAKLAKVGQISFEEAMLLASMT